VLGIINIACDVSVRPAICRLYGVVQAMQCPYRKAKQYLSDDEAINVLRACGVLGTSKQMYPVVRLAEEVNVEGVIPKN